MLDYILKNKEWIFSGAGVSAVGLLFLALRYFFRRNALIHRKNEQSIPTNTPESQPHRMIQPGDIPQEDVYRILQELEEMPPLHLEDVIQNYIGLSVNWLTEYGSAYKKDDDLIRVLLTLTTKSFRPINVSCEVKLSEYKQFSILKRKAKVRVMGNISKFEPYSFELSNVKLFFEK